MTLANEDTIWRPYWFDLASEDTYDYDDHEDPDDHDDFDDHDYYDDYDDHDGETQIKIWVKL